MYRDKRVAVVVPAYNESGHVGAVIEAIPSFVDRVYAVDDGSSDDTWNEVRTAASAVNRWATPVAADGGTQRVVPIRHGDNRGIGAALKTGYRRALDDEVDVVAVMAGDDQMDPERLPDLLDPVVEGEADYAKGNRLLNLAYVEEMSRFRLFGNGLLTFLTKIASGYWKTMDPQNGYTAISREALSEVDLEGLTDEYGFANDLLVRLNVHDARIADVAMPAKYGDEESGIDIPSFARTLSGLLLAGFLWRLHTKYLVRDFHPLALFYYAGAGVSTVGVGLATVAGWRLLAGESFAVAAVGATVVGCLGLLFLLQAMWMDMRANASLETRSGV